MGFGVLESTGSETTDSDDLLAAADEIGFSDDAAACVFVVSGRAGLLDGNSVRLRLAVALAGELGSPSVEIGEGVVALDSVEMETTGGTTNELETPVDDIS